MFGFSSRIDFASRIYSNLKLEIVASDSVIDFYTQIYFYTQFYKNVCKKIILPSTHFYKNVRKHK
jgi:hypothetical protein